MIVGFAGYKGAGKDCAADGHWGAHQTKFAAPLKAMLKALYEAAGMRRTEIERRIEGDLKEVPCPLLCGKTPRYAMQTLGHEWRNLIGEELWSRIWAAQVGKLPIRQDVIVSDVRYPHEVAAVRALGGIIARIDRPGLTPDLSHPSEQQVASLDVDVILLNNGSRDDLQRKAWELFNDY